MRSRRLGSALRRLREAARLDQQQAAEYIGGSKAKISRVEAGQVAARPGDVRLLLELYGVQDPDVSRHLEQLARDSNKRGWWWGYPLPDGTSDYIALEADATCIRTWQPLLVPGLLQTAGYTRELIKGNSEIVDPDAAEHIVTVRQERRHRFEKAGTRFAAVIGEEALTASIPSAEVHREQLADLLTASRSPNLSIQVLPASEWRLTRCSPSFVMLSFDGEWAPTVAAQDTFRNIALAEESEVISSYAHTFETLRTAALGLEQSAEFIRSAMAAIS
ncbi:helix-turn-helix domain-containing protein [Streptomyces albus]|uniref:XRE family transcriptional regulator n=2 Tax=Streptomyces TaxID=1883 RepID=A0A6C1BZQ1_9ACTN|nr:helix-turn-helix transcriptional regulator [Streptomyces albus]QID36258.1 helix-turn-helix domain-containing protein [Streptomyces albus]TGG83336.1 XRE family transcriptional regulator [Streptomyces albus]UVN56912.1 helix-turn-helix domain-containing protein [Streptomyces albus]